MTKSNHLAWLTLLGLVLASAEAAAQPARTDSSANASSSTPSSTPPVTNTPEVGASLTPVATTAQLPQPIGGQSSSPPNPLPPGYVPVAAPPGYLLVPVSSLQTSPQRRGALAPGMELPYVEGAAPPPGYRLVEQPRQGLVIGGALSLGVPWLFSSTAAVAADFEDGSAFLMIPAIGPWLMLATDNPDDSGARAVLYLDGMVQAAGTVMLAFGMTSPRKRFIRSDITVSFAPTTLGADGYGLATAGTF